MADYCAGSWTDMMIASNAERMVGEMAVERVDYIAGWMFVERVDKMVG